jgi:hypothetical protein
VVDVEAEAVAAEVDGVLVVGVGEEVGGALVEAEEGGEEALREDVEVAEVLVVLEEDEGEQDSSFAKNQLKCTICYYVSCACQRR